MKKKKESVAIEFEKIVVCTCIYVRINLSPLSHVPFDNAYMAARLTSKSVSTITTISNLTKTTFCLYLSTGVVVCTVTLFF